MKRMGMVIGISRSNARARRQRRDASPGPRPTSSHPRLSLLQLALRRLQKLILTVLDGRDMSSVRQAVQSVLPLQKSVWAYRLGMQAVLSGVASPS
jgi:hypothetical protein